LNINIIDQEKKPLCKTKEIKKVLLQRAIEGRIQGKPTRDRKRIGMLSGLMGKK